MYTREEIDQLVKKARRRDRAAFGELMELYQNDLHHLAWTLVGSKDEADDMTAEAFVRAWQHIASFRDESQFKTWLWRILINVCRSHLRRRYLQRKIFFWKTLLPDDRERLTESEWVDKSHTYDPEHAAEQTNIRQVVQWARLRLSIRENEVFALKYDKDMKISEIGALLSLSENTVKVLLFRAMKKMAHALKDYRK